MSDSKYFEISGSNITVSSILGGIVLKDVRSNNSVNIEIDRIPRVASFLLHALNCAQELREMAASNEEWSQDEMMVLEKGLNRDIGDYTLKVTRIENGSCMYVLWDQKVPMGNGLEGRVDINEGAVLEIVTRMMVFHHKLKG